MKRKQKKVSKAANGELKIEHNVPIPGIVQHRTINSVLHSMKPKDSILLAVNSNAAGAMANRAFGSGNYTIRKVDAKLTRVWRTK